MEQNNSESKFAWKSQHEGFQDALTYLKGRQQGEIKSLITAWDSFNTRTVNGIEWHQTIGVGARSGGGKTLWKDQLIRDLFRLNPTGNFRVLEFQLEMVTKASAIREFSSVTKKDYRTLCSAETPIDQSVIDDCFAYAVKKVKYPIHVIEKSPTVEEFELIIRDYMQQSFTLIDKTITLSDGTKTNVKFKQFKPAIITIDHTILIKRGKGERDTLEMLYNLLEKVTLLKREYPITFIILSQLNRSVEHPDRCENGSYGNYINEGDFFGSDALLMHSDMLIGIDKPWKRKITEYGPERFIIDDPNILVVNYLKVRNGEPGASFFTARFDIMEMHQALPPAQAQRKMRAI